MNYERMITKNSNILPTDDLQSKGLISGKLICNWTSHFNASLSSEDASEWNQGTMLNILNDQFRFNSVKTSYNIERNNKTDI